MGKTVSRTLSVAQEHELLAKLEAAGLTSELAQRVIDSRGNKLAKAAVEFIGRDGQEVVEQSREREVASSPDPTTFSLTIDYSQPLSAMIAAGHYDWVNSDITGEHFPITGNGQVEREVVLFHFGRTISSDGATQELDQAGFRAATIEELLALGANQPDLQKKFPIVALGAVWQSPHGNRHVPCLDWDGRERDLDLHWLDDDWDSDCRFAAVRK